MPRQKGIVPIRENGQLTRYFLPTDVSDGDIIRDVGPWCNGSTLTCPVKRCGFESRRVHSVLINKERPGGQSGQGLSSYSFVT
jgi:hypothetical protein